MFRFATLAGLALLAAGPAAAQRVHRVALVQAAEDQFRFEPARVIARAGDLLVFEVRSGGPYVVAFDAADLSAQDRSLLEAAFGGPSGGLRSPALARAGDAFQITVPALAAGSYRFTCITHVSYRMTGVLQVR